MKHFLFITLLLAALVDCTYAQTQKDFQTALLHYADKEYDKSFQEFLRQEKYGVPEVDFRIGMHYEFGQGTKTNINKALEYYKLAAHKGCSYAQENICDIFYRNDISDKDDLYKYARMYAVNVDYCDVSGLGSDNAYYSLYLCYKNGWGVKKNPKLERIWLDYAAYKDCFDSRDLFEDLHEINLSNLSEDQRDLFILGFLYDDIRSACKSIYDIENDDALETKFFVYLSNLKHYYSVSMAALLEALNNPKLEDVGRSFLLAQLTNNGKEGNSRDIEEYKKLNHFDDDEINEWIYSQLAKFMLKIDLLLSPTAIPKGTTNGHGWVDLGLPSGTKWATCNMGANYPSSLGSSYAWGENTAKSTFSEINYKGNPSIYVMGETDPASTQWGASWSAPTLEDWFELMDYCDINYIPNENCYRIVGPNGQEIVIPHNTKKVTFYWSNTKIPPAYEGVTSNELALGIYPTKFCDKEFNYNDIWQAGFIRPVLKNFTTH